MDVEAAQAHMKKTGLENDMRILISILKLKNTTGIKELWYYPFNLRGNVFLKTNIFQPLLGTHVCACQGVRKVSFS